MKTRTLGATLALAVMAMASAYNASAQSPKFKARIGGDIIAPAKAPAKIAGTAPFTVPYIEDFNTDPGDGYGYYDRLDYEDGKLIFWRWDQKGYMGVYNSFPKGYNAWLATPGIRMEKGKIYEVSLIAWAEQRYSSPAVERFEIKLGKDQAPEAMTQQVLDFVDVTAPEGNPQAFKTTFTVAEDGVYNLGIHALQNHKDGYTYLYIDDLNIKTASVEGAPAMVEDLAVVADIHGATKVDITFTAPAKTHSGEALTAITDVEIQRDGAAIKTFANPAPGEALSYTDTDMYEGEYVYTVITRSAAGTSLPVSKSAYVGFSIPNAPEWARVSEDPAKPGHVLITWAPVTTDIHGKIYPEGTVKYYIATNDYVVARGYGETSVDDSPVVNGQGFVDYGVYAQAPAYGYSEGYASTEILPVGEAYVAPFFDSFTNGDTEYAWGYDYKRSVAGKTGWDIGTSDGDPLVDHVFDCYDDDNGFLSASCTETGQYTWLSSAKIDTRNLDNPYVSFAYYVWGNEKRPDKFELYAREITDDDWELLGTYSTGREEMEEGWERAFVPVPQLKGKVIQIAFRYTMDNHYFGMLDAVKVVNVYRDDLAVMSVSTPISTHTGETHSVSAVIENMGYESHGGYTVDLLLNGKKIDTATPGALALGDRVTVRFRTSIGVNNPEACNYQVRVNLSDDNDTSNDIAEPSQIVLLHPNYPVPALSGKATADGHELVWTAPDTSAPVPSHEFESFETYGSFMIDEIAPWDLKNGDYSFNYPVEDLDFPNNGESFAYIVMDGKKIRKQMLMGHSGIKSMVAFASKLDLNDDWLVSPMLWDGGQTVSFYARTVAAQFGAESFEFLVSSTDKSMGSFERVEEVAEVPAEWTRYTYSLPAGTKYFAIRCVSEDKFAFQVDDIKYIPADNELPDLTLVGYNVYRDNEKVNETPLTATTYADKTAGDHTYNVTAVYAAGESALSAPYGAGASGIGSIGSDDNTPAVYYNLQGIRVDNPSAGIYIVRKGNNARKVMIK